MNTGAQTATTIENAMKTMVQTAETPQNAMKTEAQTAKTSQNAMKTVVQAPLVFRLATQFLWNPRPDCKATRA